MFTIVLKYPLFFNLNNKRVMTRKKNKPKNKTKPEKPQNIHELYRWHVVTAPWEAEAGRSQKFWAAVRCADQVSA